MALLSAGHLLVVRAGGPETARDIGSFSLSRRGIPIAPRVSMKPLVLLALISLLALAISVPRILPAGASSNPKPEPVTATSCVDRYNSLLESAKAALTAGDRATTTGLLEEAKRIIPFCPGLQDIGSPQTPLLAENACDGARIPPSISSAARACGSRVACKT
jgi:hypothetical protein